MKVCVCSVICQQGLDLSVLVTLLILVIKCLTVVNSEKEEGHAGERERLAGDREERSSDKSFLNLLQACAAHTGKGGTF